MTIFMWRTFVMPAVFSLHGIVNNVKFLRELSHVKTLFSLRIESTLCNTYDIFIGAC